MIKGQTSEAHALRLQNGKCPMHGMPMKPTGRFDKSGRSIVRCRQYALIAAEGRGKQCEIEGYADYEGGPVTLLRGMPIPPKQLPVPVKPKNSWRPGSNTQRIRLPSGLPLTVRDGVATPKCIEAYKAHVTHATNAVTRAVPAERAMALAHLAEREAMLAEALAYRATK